MSGTDWLIVAIVAILLLAVAAGAWFAVQSRRRSALRRRFGPEYDRTLADRGDRRAAEKDLSERASRHDRLRIRALTPDQRERFAREWSDAQGRFVDDPSGAVAQAGQLVGQVMTERGYPDGEVTRRMQDLSVDHPEIADDYRAADEVAKLNDAQTATTEQLRQGMTHYRSLLDVLLSDARSGTDAPEQGRPTGG